MSVEFDNPYVLSEVHLYLDEHGISNQNSHRSKTLPCLIIFVVDSCRHGSCCLLGRIHDF